MVVKVLGYNEPESLVIAAMKAYTSERWIKKHIRRTQGGKITKFKNKGWVHPHIPLGYRKKDDWIEVDEEEAEVVESIFEKFLDSENYTETARVISERFEDVFDEKLERYKIKSIVTNSVYIGKPTYGDEVEVEDQSLSIVNEETFSEAQELVEKIHEKNSGGKEEYFDSNIKEFGFDYLSRKTDIAAVCKKCGSIMVKSGSKVKYGVKVGQYKCPECGHQSTVPLGAHLREIEGRKLISCPYCRVTEDFIVDQVLSGRYRYQCKSCGGVFFSKANPDKYLREYPSEDEGDED